jgi:2-methylaconitate cis-trans-isomerase PrpF
VDFYFGQVSIDKPLVRYKGNCGNISSAVGPFAIEEGLARAEEPVTELRILQVNTNKMILARVPVKHGLYDEAGCYAIDGVPGTGGKITLQFVDPGGSVTQRLLPTGNVRDFIEVPDIGRICVSIVDAGNPVVFARASELGLKGTEIDEIDDSLEVKTRLEAVRSRGAVLIGLASSPEEASEKSQDVPKIAIVSAPQEYETPCGQVIREDDIDLLARIMSMGTLHKAYAVTGAICTAGAAKMDGTVVNEVLSQYSLEKEITRLGHPGGIISVGAKIAKRDGSFDYEEAVIGRTARRLMDGHIYVPEECLCG